MQSQGQWRSISTELSPDRHPILRKEVEAAVKTLQKGRSAGVENIVAEREQAGGEDIIIALMTICNTIWQTGEWPTPWTQSLVITPPRKGNLQQCQNYRAISLICHPSKVMLKIILNGLKPQAEKIIADEQAGFTAGRSTTEQVFLRESSVRKIPAPARPLSCLHRLREGLRQSLACSFVGNHEEVEHQRRPYPSHQTPL